MDITLHKTETENRLPPVLSAPPSKSDAHRLLILCALSKARKETDEPISLSCRDTNADIDATIRCLCALGADIKAADGGFTVRPIPRVKQENRAATPHEIAMDVGESGSTLRFLIPVIGALGVSAVIKMHGRLPHRPIAPLDHVLSLHGVTTAYDPEDETLLHVSGVLTPGTYEIDGSVSSQFISGLLFALPLLSAPSELIITNSIASAPYIALTLSALKRFGYIPKQSNDGHRYHIEPAVFSPLDGLSVEGDWSGAAFLLCAGAMSGLGVSVSALSADSVQGDRRILDVLAMTGCTFSWKENIVTLSPPKTHPLKPFTVDADAIPDLVPPMAALACACVCSGNEQTVISGCKRLKIKESNRLEATVRMVRALGGNACAETTADGDDRILISGTGTLPGKNGAPDGYTVDGCNDHRMVMSAALCALIAHHDIKISDREAIRKSYPGFFEDLQAFGIQGMRNEQI